MGFGLISTAAPRTVIACWRPLLADLANVLGRPVTPKVYDDYAGVIWAMAAGKVQVAWLGNKSAIEAVDRAGGEVALRAVDPAGRTEYHSHLLVRRDSGLTDVAAVLARASRLTFGDGDHNSTSGHVVPAYYLFAARGISPRGVFKRVVQGNHEDNYLGVAEGRLDVATGNSVDLERLRSRYPQYGDTVVAIWTSPPIPMDPIVWRADLAPGLKERIRAFFLAYGRPQPGKTAGDVAREKATLATVSRAGFRVSDNSQLVPIRIIELYLEQTRLEAAGNGQDAAVRDRLAVIGERLRALREKQTGNP